MKQENNKVTMVGTVTEEFEFSHEVYGEKFYRSHLSVARLSGTYDIIPIVVSERLMDMDVVPDTALKVLGEVPGWKDTVLKVQGNFRSYNEHIGEKSRLVLSVFVTEVELAENSDLDESTIEIKGFLCKDPVYRKTPSGKEICDLLVAVNRAYGKSDYIPCICWGRTAKYIGNHGKTGDKVVVTGRIQSRTYRKKVSETETEERTAYEVSAAKLYVEQE